MRTYDRGAAVKSYEALTAAPAAAGESFALPSRDGVAYKNYTMQVNVAAGAPVGLTITFQLSLDGVNWVDAGSLNPAAIGSSQLVVNDTPALYMRVGQIGAYTPNGSSIDVLLMASAG
jgi:hypothetical protein